MEPTTPPRDFAEGCPPSSCDTPDHRMARGNRVTAHSPPDRHTGRGRWEPTLKQACSRINESATCVQRFDDSLNSAIRTTYRISLRSSSLWEPRHPLLKVVMVYFGWAAGCSTAAHSFSFFVFWGWVQGTAQPELRESGCTGHRVWDDLSISR